MRDFVPLTSQHVPAEATPEGAPPNVVSTGTGNSAGNGESSGGRHAKGKLHADSTDSGGESPPRLALQGLSRLTDSIRNIARDRREQILLQAAELRQEMDVASEGVEGARSKLESLQRIHQTWVAKIPGTQDAYNRANALQTLGKESASLKTMSSTNTGISADNSEVEAIWDDTFTVAQMNLEFVTDRVSKLRDSIAAQEKTLDTNEVAFRAIRADNQKKSTVLKLELAKMDALIEFLNHPDFFPSQ